MRKKFKQVLCMFSALVVMICCAVPAFADDIGNSYTTWNDTIKQNVFSCIPDSDKSDYYTVIAAPNGNGFTYTIIFCKSSTSVTYFGSNLHCYVSMADYNAFACVFVTSENKPIYDDIATQWWSENGDYYDHDPYDYSGGQYKVIYSNVPVLNWEDKKTPVWEDPNAVPAPFTVTYSPDLKLNLKRKTSDYETKSIDVTLTLNQDYLDWYIRRYAEMLGDKEVGTYDSASIKMILDSILNTLDVAKDFDLTGCGKSKCIYFISLSDPSKPLRTVTQNSVYTYLSQQRYSIIDRDNGDIDGSTSTAVYANGLYPYFTVDFNEYFKHSMQSDIASENCSYKKYQAVIKNLPTYQLSIPLENIDAEKFEVISVLNSILTCETLFPTESGQSVFNGSFKSAYSVDRGPNGVNFNNIDYINVDKWDTVDTGYLDYFSKSDCYSVYTAQFSFDSYPKYVPLKDGKGNDIDMIKTNPFDFSKSPVAPGTYQSVNKDGTLSEERTLEEQKKHDKDNTFSKNFASVDYTDFSSIFSTSSSYFEFLTASIRILPDWFIATFTAWFVTFLTLALIKYVIQ